MRRSFASGTCLPQTPTCTPGRTPDSHRSCQLLRTAGQPADKRNRRADDGTLLMPRRARVACSSACRPFWYAYIWRESRRTVHVADFERTATSGATNFVRPDPLRFAPHESRRSSAEQKNNQTPTVLTAPLPTLVDYQDKRHPSRNTNMHC